MNASTVDKEEIAQYSATWLARIYERTGLQPPPPPDVESPAELLQCWESLSPTDRSILVKYARLLSAEDMIPLQAKVLRDAVSDPVEEFFVYSRGARQGLLGLEALEWYRKAREPGPDA